MSAALTLLRGESYALRPVRNCPRGEQNRENAFPQDTGDHTL